MEGFQLGASIEVCINPFKEVTNAVQVLQEATATLGITLCKEVATAIYTPFVGKLKGTAWAPVQFTHGVFSSRVFAR